MSDNLSSMAHNHDAMRRPFSDMPDNNNQRHHSDTSSSGKKHDNVLNPIPTVSTLKSTTPCLDQPTPTAQTTNETEHSLSLREALHIYPKAITWSILLSLTLVMEDYSTILTPNLFALDPFRRHFGTPLSSGRYDISAEWQSALVNGPLAGQIIGLFVTGYVAERFGYRWTLQVGLVAMAACVFVPFFAGSKAVLLAGQTVMGVPWGVFQCVSTVYAADVCPVALRAFLTM